MKRNLLAAVLVSTMMTTIAVTGCGASVPNEGNTTKAEAAADEEKTETVVKPLYHLENADDALADGGYSVSFTADDLLETDDGYELTVNVYDYDRYETADIEGLTKGSKIQFCNEEVTVEDIETDSDAGYVTINGGIENGGFELMKEDNLYRSVTFDNYPVYYSVGGVTILFAEDITFDDNVNADGETEIPTVEAKDIPDAIKNSDTDFTCNNTVITVRQEKIVQIIRYWMP